MVTFSKSYATKQKWMFFSEHSVYEVEVNPSLELLLMLTSLEIYMAAGSKISVKFNSALMIKIVLHNFLSVTPFGNAMFQKRERWQL